MTDPRTPHKHAAVIKAWADGAEIEWKHPNSNMNWVGTPFPSWNTTVDYRVKPVPHKWQKEMDAQAAGKEVQYRMAGSKNWLSASQTTRSFWNFDGEGEYRIKPELVERYLFAVQFNGTGDFNMTSHRKNKDNLKLTFEDGKLIAAEVLNG